ncbi:uncharacterized protein LOC116971208 [Amblyraja radiata]|uniref:uncharacterized protein LOC116971208 n=1 Tax=Amblyraja radiata TaxID=386614 RepID=UPI001402646F|nr:uncharacterized protein LOC116971208 [Amblyraja radiata]
MVRNIHSTKDRPNESGLKMTNIHGARNRWESDSISLDMQPQNFKPDFKVRTAALSPCYQLNNCKQSVRRGMAVNLMNEEDGPHHSFESLGYNNEIKYLDSTVSGNSFPFASSHLSGALNNKLFDPPNHSVSKNSSDLRDIDTYIEKTEVPPVDQFNTGGHTQTTENMFEKRRKYGIDEKACSNSQYGLFPEQTMGFLHHGLSGESNNLVTVQNKLIETYHPMNSSQVFQLLPGKQLDNSSYRFDESFCHQNRAEERVVRPKFTDYNLLSNERTQVDNSHIYNGIYFNRKTDFCNDPVDQQAFNQGSIGRKERKRQHTATDMNEWTRSPSKSIEESFSDTEAFYRHSTSSPERKYRILPEMKKRKLTYEKVPGRIDGQTRLIFF